MATTRNDYSIRREGALIELEKALFNNSGNSSAFRDTLAPPWVASPSIRGTASILWSCIITLIACIFTALHLNVPANTKKLPMLREKIKWVLIGLIAPEVVLYLASSQFLDSRRLSKELTALWVRKRATEGVDLTEKELNDNDEEPCFDIRYGFFVVMGGLEISVKDIQHYTIREADRGSLESGSLRLSVNGVLQLARMGHFIAIPTSLIDDKSKADTLQKFIIIAQVLWMGTQCTVRKVYGLPVSLLEIYTMVHVACALVMCVFWMRKPKDVTDPMTVDSSEFLPIVALMVQEQFHFRKSDEFIIYPKSSQRESLAAFVWIHPTDTNEYKHLADDDYNTRLVEWVQPEGSLWILKTGEALLPSGLGIVARSWTWQSEMIQRRVLPDWYNDHSYDDPWDIPEGIWITETLEVEPIPLTVDLQLADILRWERVIRAIELIDGPVRKPELFHPQRWQVRYQEQHFHDAFTRSAGNFQYTGDSPADPDQILQFIFSSPILLTLLLILPGIYGGIHLIASNLHFATEIEELLWEISSIDIIVTMPVFFILTYAGSKISQAFFDYESLGENAFATVYKLPGHVLLFGYILARSYLVVESFVSLRSVPIGTYWIPSWLQMIPHV